MNCIISGKNFKLTEGIKDALYRKLSKLDKYFDEEASAKIVCGTDAGIHRIEITISYRGKLIRSEVETNDLYTSMDVAVMELERKIIKYKTKILKSRKEQPTKRDEFCSGENLPMIQKTKRCELTTMTPEDACQEMDMLGHDFYAFLNVENGLTSIVYTRRNGNYGILILE